MQRHSKDHDVACETSFSDPVMFAGSNACLTVVPYKETYQETVWGHMDPDRLAVPRYMLLQ